MKPALACLLVGLLSFAASVMGDVASLPKPEELPVAKELPDPLVCMDGTRVTTRQQWEKQRRPELKRLFQHYMYGYFPPPQKITATVERQRDDYFGGKAVKKEVTIRFGPEGTPPIHLLLVTPNTGRPSPVFVGLNFNGNHAVLDDPEIALPTVWMRDNKKGVVNNKATDEGRGSEVDVWNVRYVVEHGYSVATFYHGDVDPDKGDPTDGMPAAFRKAGLIEDGEDACATIAAWAYGIHRVVDYLEQDKSIDRDRIAVVGHSRNGKAALLAGAFDERIDLVIPLQAGCGGTAPSRGTVGESVKVINEHFPHWFDATFKKFNDEPQRLPFDQHCLIALCAPRPVLLPNATEDQWANPAGQFEMLKAAEPVYKLLGAGGCAAEKMPETGELVDSTLGYWIRPGKHSMTKADWEIFLRYADKHFKTGHARAE
jgi:hypothetical protein